MDHIELDKKVGFLTRGVSHRSTLVLLTNSLEAISRKKITSLGLESGLTLLGSSFQRRLVFKNHKPFLRNVEQLFPDIAKRLLDDDTY